jgi:hypothetical protein
MSRGHLAKWSRSGAQVGGSLKLHAHTVRGWEKRPLNQTLTGSVVDCGLLGKDPMQVPT